MQITIDDVEIEVVRKKMKSLRIIVFRATGKVRISAPLRVSDEVIKDFAFSKINWIKKHQARYANQPTPLFPESKEQLEFYREQLKVQVPSLIVKWQEVIGVQISSYKIRSMRTRWGSCNIRAKRISLNVALAKKSLHCLEYIIVHELVHLLERYHNKNFYSLLDQFMPHWRLCEAELEG